MQLRTLIEAYADVMHRRAVTILQEQRPSLLPQVICIQCGEWQRKDCDGKGWLEPIGPCRDGSYITSRPCPNDNPSAGD